MAYRHTNYFIVISDVSYISVPNITSISLLGIMLQKRTEPHRVLARPATGTAGLKTIFHNAKFRLKERKKIPAFCLLVFICI